jgi:hypothetical protein
MRRPGKIRLGRWRLNWRIGRYRWGWDLNRVVGEMILGIGLSPRWIGTADAKWDYFTPETDDFIGGWSHVGGIHGN